MAVIHGSKADIFLNGFNAGNWFNSVTAAASKELNDATVLNNAGYKMYHARMKEATFSCTGFFDATADADLASAATLDPTTGDYALHNMIQGGVVGSANDTILHFPAGALAIGDKGFGGKGAGTTYEISGGSGDLLGASMELTSCVGREKVRLLTAGPSAQVDAFTGASVDNTASSADGGSAYLMVPTHVSGTLPVVIEHSADNSAWSTLASFANVTADNAHERITFSGTVNRYVRAKAVGTYSATFLVAIHRN